MASSERKKELRSAYKERPELGGVCAIRCVPAGRTFLYAAPDIRGQQNRFQFSVSTGTCVHAALAADWRTYGSGAFTFQVLEELEQGPNQSMPSFRADLDALADMWRDKLDGEGVPLYGPERSK